MKHRNDKSFILSYICEEEVLNVSDHLSNKTSTDCNNISMALITKCIESIITPFTYICNKSFEFGIFPDNMKIAKVIPVFKSGENHNLIITDHVFIFH